MTAEKMRRAGQADGRARAGNARPRRPAGLGGKIALVAKLAVLVAGYDLATFGGYFGCIWLAMGDTRPALICMVGIACVVCAVGCLIGICRCGAAAGMRP